MTWRSGCANPENWAILAFMEPFSAIFEQHGGMWIGFVEELPGANTQGETLDEARENLHEAVRMVLEANREIVERELKGRNVIREQLVLAS